MMRVKNKNRLKLIGSLKKIIPTMTAPVAPSPVQIAYAVASGISFMAKAKNRKPNENVTITNIKRNRFFFSLNKLIDAIPKTSPKLAKNK